MTFFAYPLREEGFLDDQVDWSDLSVRAEGETAEAARENLAPLLIPEHVGVIVLNATTYNYKIFDL